MLKLKNLVKTCDSCPSQWEGYDDKGNFIYIRYRYGMLRIVKNSQTLSVKVIGDGFDGTMSTKDMLKYTGIRLNKEP